jgi:predicted alpha-1,2-mannosidase
MPMPRFPLAAALFAAVLPLAAAPLPDLVREADPMCGTGAHANTFPGAVAPFGMIQWSPDTEAGKHKGGYSDLDHRISGFSLDHLSGAGCTYGENFSFMPLLAPGTASPDRDRTAFAVPFSHARESARPGRYAVTLDDGISVELTASTRVGFGRFTFPASAFPTLAINAASAVNGAVSSWIRIDPARRAVSGAATSGHFCRGPDQTTVYFCAVFDRPFARYAAWSGPALVPGAASGRGRASGAYVSFSPADGRTVQVKVAISYVSAAGAEANLAAERPPSAFAGGDFDAAARQAAAVWNRQLNRIQVFGGTPAERRTFYSMLYHALMAPTVCSDADGRYRGYDGRVHLARGRVQYADFSGWDIYRSECQLLAMIAPREAGDMAQSLLEDYRQGGTFPRWGVPNEDSGEMIGDPAAPMIADFYAFGARTFDARAALAGLLRAATDPSVRAPRTGVRERNGLAAYLRLGYVPESQRGGSVSMTLEYTSADYALAEFARALGDDRDAAILGSRAADWRNLFNPATGYIQMRRADGSWAPGFVNTLPAYDGVRAYVEGTAGQYVWMVPFDLRTLAEKMGGDAVAAKRLDAYFGQLKTGWGKPDSWMADMGNENCLNAPWIYDFLGRPYRTQATVRRIMTQLYSDRDIAYPGNDDLGEMSSWYVFAALGLYPEIPGSDVLVLGSPLFPRAVIHLAGGDAVVVGRGAAADAPYVQGLTVNGRPCNRPWIRFSDLARGGELDFTLGRQADPAWGSRRVDAPPSLAD